MEKKLNVFWYILLIVTISLLVIPIILYLLEYPNLQPIWDSRQPGSGTHTPWGFGHQNWKIMMISKIGLIVLALLATITLVLSFVTKNKKTIARYGILFTTILAINILFHVSIFWLIDGTY